MATGEKHLNSLRKRIEDLLNIERSHMCWELGHFQAPTFTKETGETPTKPHMLVCIDTASLAIMGNDLLLDSPSPQDLLTLLVVSMERPFLGISAAVLPESVHLDDPAVLELIESEFGHLDVKVKLVKRFSALPEFRKIVERDLFSLQAGYSGRVN
jgi:hypothetical protein